MPAIAEPTLTDGVWTYPDAWTVDDRAAWEGTVGQGIHETAERERIEAASKAALLSPALLLAAKRAEVDEAKRQREMAQRRARGQVAWVQARAAHGADVDMFETIEGDFVIVLFMDSDEVKAAERKVELLRDAAIASVTPQSSEADIKAAELRSLSETVGAWKDETLKKVTVGGLSPDESRARLKYLMHRYGSIWPKIVSVRDALIHGFREREGKGSALS